MWGAPSILVDPLRSRTGVCTSSTTQDVVDEEIVAMTLSKRRFCGPLPPYHTDKLCRLLQRNETFVRPGAGFSPERHSLAGTIIRHTSGVAKPSRVLLKAQLTGSHPRSTTCITRAPQDEPLGDPRVLKPPNLSLLPNRVTRTAPGQSSLLCDIRLFSSSLPPPPATSFRQG